MAGPAVALFLALVCTSPLPLDPAPLLEVPLLDAIPQPDPFEYPGLSFWSTEIFAQRYH